MNVFGEGGEGGGGEGGGAADGGRRAVSPPLVIPAQPDTFGPGARRANPDRFRPEAGELSAAAARGPAERFEAAPADDAGAAAKPAYGLEVRGGCAPPARSTPSGRDERQELREDLERLPAPASEAAYEAMPVEHFGAALLRGMGWQEGRALGREGGEEVQAVEYVRRPGRLGLGAQPDAEAPGGAQDGPGGKRRPPRPGEATPRPDLVYRDRDGNQRHVKGIDDALEERDAFLAPGALVRVRRGRHEGLHGEVLEREPVAEGRSERARVRLRPSGVVASVRVQDLDASGEAKSAGEAAVAEKPAPAAAGQPRKRRRRERPWLVAGIRVRVVDKSEVQGGRLYQKKADIVDVPSPYQADIVLASGEVVPGVDQSCLETYVPDVKGTALLVVRGDRRGQHATLLARSRGQDRAAVQFDDDLAVETLHLDDVSSRSPHLP